MAARTISRFACALVCMQCALADKSSSTLASMSAASSWSNSSSLPSISSTYDIGAAILGGLSQAVDSSSSGIPSSFSQTSLSSTSLSSTGSFLEVSSASSLSSSAGFSTAVSAAVLTSRSINSSYECQSALVSWTHATDAIASPILVTVTSFQDVKNGSRTIEYGEADIYSTENGFARAHGNFTITSTALAFIPATSIVFTSHFELQTPSSLQHAGLPPKPNCTIDISSCAALWTEYLRSTTDTPYIGGDAPAPSSWPPPDNSPRCWATSTGCTTISTNYACEITGHSAQLFYWPTAASGASSAAHLNRSTIKTVVVEGITMTSPSIYLSFDVLSAASLSSRYEQCIFVDKLLGTRLIHRNFAAGSYVGATQRGSIAAFKSDEISTLEKLMDDGREFPSSAIEAMAHPSGSQYQYWASVIYGGPDFNWSYTTKQIDVDKLMKPAPRAYYLRPIFVERTDENNAVSRTSTYAQGCNLYGDTPGCNTIFDDVYRAQLALPDRVKELDPNWSPCRNIRFGIYDPPVALTEASEVNMPMTTPITMSTIPPPTPVPVQTTPTVTATAQTKQHTDSPLASVSTVIMPGTASTPATQPTGPTNTQNTRSEDPASVRTPTNARTSVPDGGSAPSDAPTNGSDTGTHPIDSSKTQVVVTTTHDTGTVEASVVSSAVNHASDSPPGQTVRFTSQAASDALHALTASTLVPVAVVSAASITAVRNGGDVVVGTQTLHSGQAAVIDGAILSNAATAVVVQTETPTSTSVANVIHTGAAVFSIGSVAVTASKTSGDVVVGEKTLHSGQAVTIGGATVSHAGSDIVVENGQASSAVYLPDAVQTDALATFSTRSVAFTASKVLDNVIIGDKTIHSGQEMVIDGATISNDGSAIVILTGQITSAIPFTDASSITIAASSLSATNGIGSIIASGLAYAGGAADVSVNILLMALFVILSMIAVVV